MIPGRERPDQWESRSRPADPAVLPPAGQEAPPRSWRPPQQDLVCPELDAPPHTTQPPRSFLISKPDTMDS